MTTTPPTPDEITAALDLLRRIPGVRDIDSLGVIDRMNTPLRWMARELHEVWSEKGLPVQSGTLAIVLEGVAARHGLYITTDPAPGELIKRALVHHADRGDWRIRAYFHLDEELPMGELATPGNRFAALYLLPEGGK